MSVRGVARENYLYESMLAGRLNDKILVIVQLEGGNDGLNTLVPVDDDLYYEARPNLAIAKEDALPIDGVPELRLNPVLEGLVPMFNEGKLAVVGKRRLRSDEPLPLHRHRDLAYRVEEQQGFIPDNRMGWGATWQESIRSSPISYQIIHLLSRSAPPLHRSLPLLAPRSVCR